MEQPRFGRSANVSVRSGFLMPHSCTDYSPCRYLHRSLGWGQAKSDEILLPLIKREQERKEGKLKTQAMVTDLCAYRVSFYTSASRS